MIVKGASRSSPTQLANYLLRVHANPKNETVTVLALDYGDGDLLQAFNDWHTAGEATRGEKTLYHAQISPAPAYAATMTKEQWLRAAEILTEELGLTGHARSVILHDDHERPHIHLVYERTDSETMTMWHDGQNYAKHEKASMRMEQEFGHEFVPGKHAKRDREQQPEFPHQEMNHAEHQQAQRTGLDPEERKQQIIALKESSDNAQAFKAALEEAGYVLARGDRGYLIVDELGDHFTLARQLKEKTAAVNAFMADVPLNTLPDLDEAKEAIKARYKDLVDLDAIHRPIKEKLDEEARQLKERHKAEIRQVFETTKEDIARELDARHALQDEELSLYFTKAQEFSDDWIKKYTAIREQRWNWDVADQRRLQRQQEIEDIRTRHRIERETMIQTLKQERDQQIEDLKAARAEQSRVEEPSTAEKTAEQYKLNADELADLTKAVNDRHAQEAKRVEDFQEAELSNLAYVLDRQISDKMTDFDALQTAERGRKSRELFPELAGPDKIIDAIKNRLDRGAARTDRERQWEALIERQEEKRTDKLATLYENKQRDIEDLRERHAQKQRDLKAQAEAELARYIREQEAAKRLLADLEKQQKQEEQRQQRDGPDPPTPTR